MYAILFGLAIFIDTTPKYFSTKVGSELVFDSSKFELVARNFSIKNREFSFSLAERSMANDSIPVKWSVSTEYKNGEKTNEKIQLLTGDNHYLYAHVSNVPDTWTAIRVTVTKIEGREKHSTRFLISREDVKEETSSILSQKEVQQQSLDYMIGQRLMAIETANKEIETADQSSKDAGIQTSELEKNLTYETEKQQAETTGKINHLKGIVQQNNQFIQQQEAIIKEYQEQIENLKLKKKSIES